jgi:hypothetical protein
MLRAKSRTAELDGALTCQLADLTGTAKLRLQIWCPGGRTRHLRCRMRPARHRRRSVGLATGGFDAAATSEQGTPTALPSSARPAPFLRRRAHLLRPLPPPDAPPPANLAGLALPEANLPRCARSPVTRALRLAGAAASRVGQAGNELRGELLVVAGEERKGEGERKINAKSN